jgi:hypothetical protein
MAGKSVHKSAEEAFDAETKAAFGDTYLQLIYSNWSDSVRTLRRTVLMLVLVVVGFLVLNNAESGAVELGPLRVDNLSAVLTLIPAVASYLLFEVVDLVIADHYYKEAASAPMKMIHPSIYAHDLELFLEPATGFAMGAGPTTSLKPNSSGTLPELREFCEMIVIAALIFGVLGFVGFAFLDLYGNDHTSTLAVSASLLFSFFNLVRAGLALAIAWPDMGQAD